MQVAVAQVKESPQLGAESNSGPIPSRFLRAIVRRRCRRPCATSKRASLACTQQVVGKTISPRQRRGVICWNTISQLPPRFSTTHVTRVRTTPPLDGSPGGRNAYPVSDTSW